MYEDLTVYLWNIYIVFILYWIIFWDFPSISFFKKILTKYDRFFLYFGLQHGWSFFAPHPFCNINKVYIELVLNDGRSVPFEPKWLRPSFSIRVAAFLHKLTDNVRPNFQYRFGQYIYDIELKDSHLKDLVVEIKILASIISPPPFLDMKARHVDLETFIITRYFVSC